MEPQQQEQQQQPESQLPPQQPLCPFCHFPLTQSYYFCPNCGKKLNEPPITTLKEIGVYLLSIFLPPLGLWPGIRYLFSKNQRTRRAGIIAIILTILSTIITIWLTMAFMGQLTQSLTGQMNVDPYKYISP
jgi:uncharacterized membrane protein YqaE (UPF0057 family)